jgi:hypothetical protein
VAVDADKLRQLLELATEDEESADATLLDEPEAGPEQPRRLLTIAMATYDDFDGVYFSVQALRLYHREVLDRISILVLDNQPSGEAAWYLKGLENRIPELRYVPSEEVRGTAVRDLLFRYATSDWVLCMDSHVLFEPGSLARLVDYLEARPTCDDLLQGPIAWDELDGRAATHFEPVWRAGMYGTWAVDDRGRDPEAEPFDIPMQGLGCFVARRDSWLGFNPRFRGFGGEEGYLHEKYRQHGRRTLCLPFLRWVHRFERPGGVQYPNRWEERIRNYLIGWDELGLDRTEVVEHFSDAIGERLTQRVVAGLAQERQNPFWFFDAIFCINLDRRTDRWEAVQRRFEHLGIQERVRRFPAIETPERHHTGCTLSHREIIAAAKAMGLENVLIFEDDVRFLEGTRWCLRSSLDELSMQPWDLFYLGGYRWEPGPIRLAEGCQHLGVAGQITTNHAIAYHRRVFDRVLHDIPSTVDEVAEWCRTHRAIDQYTSRGLRDRARFVAVPVVATQPNILGHEDADFRDCFTI